MCEQPGDNFPAEVHKAPAFGRFGAVLWLSAKHLFVQRQIANGYELSQKIRFFVVKINMDIKDAFPFCTNAPEYKG